MGTTLTLVVLGVSDLAKSVAFYRDQAGFDLQNRMGSLAFFAAGGVTLMLNANLRRPQGSLAGATEIVIAAESVTGMSIIQLFTRERRNYARFEEMNCESAVFSVISTVYFPRALIDVISFAAPTRPTRSMILSCRPAVRL